MIKIISEHAHALKIEVDKYLLEIFADHSLFDRRNSDQGSRARWSIGHVLSVPKNLSVEEHCTFGSGGHICTAGSFTEIMSIFPINSIIGRYCSISTDVKFLAFRHPMDSAIMSSASFNSSREFVTSYTDSIAKRGITMEFNRVSTPQPQSLPIKIGHDVWIGANVRLRGGIEIGNGAIIASDSLVTKSVPPFAIVGGNPAKIIKYRFPEEVANLLQSSEWWDIELHELHKLDIGNPEKFARSVLDRKDQLEKYNPKILKLNDHIASS